MANNTNDPLRMQTKRSRLQALHSPRGDAPAHIHPPKMSKALWQRTRRILLIFALLLVCLSSTGFLYQASTSALDVSGYPAPGKLYDVESYRLYLNCTGTGRLGSPTVILEEGLAATSLGWSKVQPGVASFTRVCSYDRAGYGLSDTGPLPRAAGRMVMELHMLLDKAAVAGPYVLVGHSFGGLIMQLYTYTYPQEVAGLVLIDSVHEDELVRSLHLRQATVNDIKQLQICRALSPFGIVRLFGFFNESVAGYPPAMQPAAKAQFYQTRFCQTVSDEEAAYEASFAQVRAARRPLGHLPLVVLTRGLPDPDPQLEQDWQVLQMDLTSLSANSTHIIATRSGHQIQLDQPDLVIAAINWVLAGKVK